MKSSTFLISPQAMIKFAISVRSFFKNFNENNKNENIDKNKFCVVFQNLYLLLSKKH